MKKIILASGSPRRKEILEAVGAKFEIVTSDIEEVVRQGESPETVVAALAFEKAIDVAEKMEEGALVIAADTIVYKDKIMGKPKDEADAFSMLQSLRNDKHTVLTGFCVMEVGTLNKIVHVVETTVYTKDYSDEKIKAYIASGEVFGKAGAYAIQGLGGLLIDRIEGDYLNVVGLPVSALEVVLEKHFDTRFL
ncbi:septum formation protein Maf [Acidaminobacter sp. JC074]|uniref:Maf family protein n=1 Tax=Acidaminobacter sp. JC074 TaxID=2530199 RepID=UPI001F11093A|nr:Maf family protein [Acidaminobacter sp. JC074]MCH4886650.1 septum formation protein Maf [Acidaminobacter sp. JC074]